MQDSTDGDAEGNETQTASDERGKILICRTSLFIDFK